MTLLCSLTGNYLNAEAAKHLAEGLAKNGTLATLKYASSHPFPCCQHPLTSPLGSRSQFNAQSARRRWGQAPCGGPQEQLSVAEAGVPGTKTLLPLPTTTDAFDRVLFAVWPTTGLDLSLECTWPRHSRSTRRSPASSMLPHSLSLLSAPPDVSCRLSLAV